MDKSADAFRTISEVSEDLDLPQHVLRFWESKFPQIKPLKRAGGRRYYRPTDVVLLRSIRRLLYDDGYTIRGVQRLLKEGGVKSLSPPEADARSVSFGHDATGAGPAFAHASSSEGPVDLAEPTPFASPSSSTLQGVLREALVFIEECERILAAVRAPTPRDGEL